MPVSNETDELGGCHSALGTTALNRKTQTLQQNQIFNPFRNPKKYKTTHHQLPQSEGLVPEGLVPEGLVSEGLVSEG